MTLTSEQIFNSLRLIPFSTWNTDAFQDHMEVMKRNRLDLSLASSWTPLDEYITGGILVLKSSTLQMHFIFANVDAGTGFFGGQKTKIATFVSRDGGDTYEAGPILGSLIKALTGVNNIYREAGVLKGLII